LRAGHAAAAAVMASVRLATPAVSLGSVDTLIQHPAGLTHRTLDESTRRAHGIGPGTLRLSVGVENVEDIWSDLAAALDVVQVDRVA
jgi:cystathionine beta-lyase/cystathionine gamma-synthase